MRAIWKGAVNFGLVSVPVSLYPATKREELKFRLLRRSDMSPINYQRVAEIDGKEVPWDEIVKGYEYEKGKFVVLTDEDFKRVDVEATQTVDIMDFVELSEVNPMMFQKPYYLEPLKGGIPAYCLLRDVLKETGKIGIAKVVIKTRQHLAALKPSGSALVLELMHFEDELLASTGLKIPPAAKGPGKRELEMARLLVDQLTIPWDAARYNDDYSSQLLALIEKKVKTGGKALPAAAGKTPRTSGKVIDLVAVLQKSLQETSGGSAAPARKPAAKKSAKKAAAPARRRAA